MSYFFRQDGAVHMKRLSLSTFFFFGLYSNAFLFSVRHVDEPGMDPILQGYNQVYEAGVKSGHPIARFLLADKVLFSKVKALPNEHLHLQGKVIALRNPYNKKEIVFRRVIATESLWVKRSDDGGIIQVPKGHVWIECECEVPSQQRNLDSITTFGPISTSLVLGEVKAIVWPLWRIQSFTSIENKLKLSVANKGLKNLKNYWEQLGHS